VEDGTQEDQRLDNSERSDGAEDDQEGDSAPMVEQLDGFPVSAEEYEARPPAQGEICGVGEIRSSETSVEVGDGEDEILAANFSHSQEGWRAASDFRLPCHQLSDTNKEVYPRYLPYCNPANGSRAVAIACCLDRFSRFLPACPTPPQHRTLVKMLRSFCESLRVGMDNTAFWVAAKSILEPTPHSACLENPQKLGFLRDLVRRRCSFNVQECHGMQPAVGTILEVDHRPGDAIEPEEVQVGSRPNNRVFGIHCRPEESFCFHWKFPNYGPGPIMQLDKEIYKDYTSQVGEVGGNSIVVPTSFAGDPRPATHSHEGSSVVGIQEQLEIPSEDITPGTTSSISDLPRPDDEGFPTSDCLPRSMEIGDRCLTPRLGCNSITPCTTESATTLISRSLGPVGFKEAHHLDGIKSRGIGFGEVLPPDSSSSRTADHHRRHNDRMSVAEGFQQDSPGVHCKINVGNSQLKEGESDCTLAGGQRQSRSRSPIKNGEEAVEQEFLRSQRLSPAPGHSTLAGESLELQDTHRPVRVLSQQASSLLCVSISRTRSCSPGRLAPGLVEVPRIICEPSVGVDRAASSEDTHGAVSDNSGGAKMGAQGLVACIDEHGNEYCSFPAQQLDVPERRLCADATAPLVYLNRSDSTPTPNPTPTPTPTQPILSSTQLHQGCRGAQEHGDSKKKQLNWDNLLEAVDAPLKERKLALEQADKSDKEKQLKLKSLLSQGKQARYDDFYDIAPVLEILWRQIEASNNDLEEARTVAIMWLRIVTLMRSNDLAKCLPHFWEQQGRIYLRAMAKGNRLRSFRIGETTVKIVSNYLKLCGAPFPRLRMFSALQSSQALSSERIAKLTLHYLEKAGIPSTRFKAHSLRGATATYLTMMKKVPEQSIRARGGWFSGSDSYAKHYDRSDQGEVWDLLFMAGRTETVTPCNLPFPPPWRKSSPPEVDEGRRKGEDDDTVVGKPCAAAETLWIKDFEGIICSGCATAIKWEASMYCGRCYTRSHFRCLPCCKLGVPLKNLTAVAELSVAVSEKPPKRVKGKGSSTRGVA
jgi:hypothetical protein